jgi:hypothetical protein
LIIRCSDPTLLLPAPPLENQQAISNTRLLKHTQRQSLFQLPLDLRFDVNRLISLALFLSLLTSIDALVPFPYDRPLFITFRFVTTWMTWPILMPRPLRHLDVVIMSTTFKLPPSPHAHPVPFHSTPWALLPHLLHSQERGSIVGLRVKAYFTCLQTRASHLGLMELF